LFAKSLLAFFMSIPNASKPCIDVVILRFVRSCRLIVILEFKRFSSSFAAFRSAFASFLAASFASSNASLSSLSVGISASLLLDALSAFDEEAEAEAAAAPAALVSPAE
jgi:hypothetical protein